MQVLFAFVVLAFILGGARRAEPVRRHPSVLLALAAMVAASMYSLRVVL